MPRTLAGRIVATTVAVAVIAVLAVSVVGFQLIRQQSIAQSRFALRTAAQAVAIASAPSRSRLIARIEQESGGRLEIGVRSGAATGAGVSGIAIALPPRALRQIAASKRLDLRVLDGSRTLLIVSVPVSGGGAVVAVEDVSILRSGPLLWRFLVAAGIGLVVAAGLGLLVGRLIARPLAALAERAGLLASGARGVLEDRPVPPHAVTEVADIHAALAELDAALAQAEGSRREFLLSISHELRTPLAAIRGYADALADGLIAPSDTTRVGGILSAETERLDGFVRDLLALARLEADDFVLSPVVFDIASVLRDTARAWEARARAVGALVDVRTDPGGVTVHSDPHRLRQLLDGLVENALRVSPQGGTVRLSAVAQPEGAVVRVDDDGPGFAPGDLPAVFVRGALRDRYAGERPVATGLGLSIAKRLAERLGAALTVDETTRGGSFVLTVPWR